MVLTSESSKIRFRDSILRSVNGLPADLRAMVILRYRERFSYEDIAARLSVSQDGVSSRLCQAVLRLHAKFGMHMGDGPSSITEPVMLSADCRSVEHYMPQYVDETLSIIHRAGVDAHTESCSACREKLARYRAVRTLLQSAYHREPLPEKAAAPATGSPTSTVIGHVKPDEPVLVDAATAAKELQKLFESEASSLPDLAAEEAKLPPPLTPVIPDESYDTIDIVPLQNSELSPVVPEVIGATTSFVPIPIESNSTTITPALVEAVSEVMPVMEPIAEPLPIPIPVPEPVIVPVSTPLPQPIAAAAAAAAIPNVPAAAEIPPSAVPEPEPEVSVVASVNAAVPIPIIVRVPLRARIAARIAAVRHALAAVPFWFVSCAFHVLLIALVMLISLKIELPHEESIVVTTELYNPKTLKTEELRDEHAVSALADRVKMGDALDTKALNDIVIPPDALNVELGDHFETNNPDRADQHNAFGDLDAHIFDAKPHELDLPGGGGNDGPALDDTIGFGTFRSHGQGGGFGGGKGTGVGADEGSGHGTFGTRTGGGRKDMIQKHGGTPATENAVNKALQWLAYHQAADGHWGEAKNDPTVFLTSISTLAFLGAGHSERAGQYKDNVTRAVRWLRSTPIQGRPLPNGVSNRNDGYSIAVMTMALAEAAGMGNVPETRAAAQKAVDYCTEVHQNGSGSSKLGWRYGPREQGDLSVSGWFIMALKSAKVAGLHVDPHSLEGAARFIDSVQFKAPDPEVVPGYDAAYGPIHGYSYMPLGQTIVPGVGRMKLTMGSDCCHTIGNLCRIFMGGKLEDLKPSITYFVKKFGAPEPGKEHLYYWYYGTLCTFQAGGDVWKEWNEGMQKSLLPTQMMIGENAGSWLPTGDYSAMWGRVGQTALSTLCLEVYYRYARLSDTKQ